MLYEIYDSNTSVFAKPALIEDKTSRAALEQYLGHSDFKRSGAWDVTWRVTPVEKTHAEYYKKVGRSCWYK